MTLRSDIEAALAPYMDESPSVAAPAHAAAAVMGVLAANDDLIDALDFTAKKSDPLNDPFMLLLAELRAAVPDSPEVSRDRYS